MAVDKDYKPAARNGLVDYVDQTIAGASAPVVPSAQPSYTESSAGGVQDYLSEKMANPTTVGGITDYLDNYKPKLPEESEDGLLYRAIMRSGYGTGSSVANLFGADETTKAWADEAAKYPAEYQSYKEIKGAGDLLGYVGETLAENTASLLTMGIGGLVGAYAGPAAAAAVGLGMAASRGAAIGAGVGNLILQSGESKDAVQQEGGEGTIGEYAPAAVMNTAMDTLSFFKVMKLAGLGKVATETIEDAAKKSGLGDFLGDTVKAMGVEGATEAAQTFVNMVNAEIQVNGEIAQLSPEKQQEIKEAMAKGVAGGGGGKVVGSGVNALANTVSGRKTLEGAADANEDANSSSEAPTPENPAEAETPDPTPTPEPVPDETPLEDEPIGTVQDEDGNVEAPAPTAEPTTPEAPESPVSETDGEPAKPEAPSMEKPEDKPREDAGETTVEDARNDIDAIQTEIDNNIAELEAGMEAGDLPIETVQLPTGQHQEEVSTLSRADTGQYHQPRMRHLGWTLKQPGKSGDTNLAGALADADNRKTSNVYITERQLGYMPKSLHKPIQQLLEHMSNTYMPGMPIIVADANSAFGERSANFLGGTTGFEKNGSRYHVIALNVKKIMDVYDQNGEAGAMETVAHEMGHVISWNTLNNLGEKARNQVYTEYRAWVKKSLKGTMAEWFNSRMPALEAQHMMKMLGADAYRPAATMFKRIFPKRNQYHLSFEEYFADNVAKIIARDPEVKKSMTPETKKFWGTVTAAYGKAMQWLMTVMKTNFDGVTAPSKKLAKFLETVALQEKINAILDYEKMNSLDNVMMKEMYNDRKAELELLLKESATDDVTPLQVGSAILDAGELLNSTQAREHIDTGFRQRWRTLLMNPRTVAERFGTIFAKNYMDIAENFAATKQVGVTEADKAARAWSKLGTDRADRLGNYLFEMSSQSDDLKRILLPDEVDALQEKYNLDTEQKEAAALVEKTFNNVRDRLFVSVFKGILKPFVPDAQKTAQFIVDNIHKPDAKKHIMKAIKDQVGETESNVMSNLDKAFAQYNQLVNKNYFPRMRFGRYILTKKERTVVDITDEEGTVTRQEVKEKVVDFQAFEYEHEQQAAYQMMLQQNRTKVTKNEVKITASALDDTTRSLYGMPQSVVDSIHDKMQEAGDGLSKEQLAALQDITMDLSPSKRFLQHLRQRQNTAGFSKDAMRTFASYVQNASAHLARIEHTDDMVANLRQMQEQSREEIGTTTDLVDMHKYFDDHMKYILNPGNDFAGLKALGFAMFLGYNLKSAYVNLTQIPLVTIPWQIARYGVKAQRHFISAGKDVTKRAHKISLKDPDERRMMELLYEDGTLDEGMYQSLIELANKSQMFAPVHKIAPKTSDAVMATGDFLVNNAGVFFSITEKYNRRVTALSTFRMEMEASGDFNAAMKAAKDSVNQTQFEYGKVNRAEIMRGAMGVPLLFMNYMQQYLSLLNNAPLYAAKKAGLYNGQISKEQMKTSLLMTGTLLAMGGAMGLPGAEYLMEMLNRILKATGVTQDELKLTMRQFLQEHVTDNPDLLMHGLMSQYGLGPAHLVNLALPDDSPWAVPKVDISASIGMGNFIPGLQAESAGDPNEIIWGLTGALGGYTRNVFKAANSTDPDEWKNMEKLMPSSLRNLSKAARYATRGAETSRGGAEFVKFDGETAGDYSAILFQALGFSPKAVTVKYESDNEKQSTSKYWAGKGQSLLENLAYQYKNHDKEGIKEARKAIVDFNQSLTLPHLKPYRITGKQIQQSLKSKGKVLKKRELGIPTQRKDRLLYMEVDKSRELIED